MDSPQYFGKEVYHSPDEDCFKPYYKWIVLNTKYDLFVLKCANGFKPYYKWIVLNTQAQTLERKKGE